MHMTFLAASLTFFCDLASPGPDLALRSRFCCALFFRCRERICQYTEVVYSEGGTWEGDVLCSVTHT